ncbi:hypothetical protein HA466_0289550 [Hirschfeldia incana]|nr:hypothetical protein HA466_0289550 [Hirschfeldia incana]
MRNRGCNLSYYWISESINTEKSFQLFTFSFPQKSPFFLLLHRFSLQAQYERADNCGLKEENDRIRCENIAIREALKHAICPTCCDTPFIKPPILMNRSFD